jgi:hypothetical protein
MLVKRIEWFFGSFSSAVESQWDDPISLLIYLCGCLFFCSFTNNFGTFSFMFLLYLLNSILAAVVIILLSVLCKSDSNFVFKASQIFIFLLMNCM